jgi:hypothetical protein
MQPRDTSSKPLNASAASASGTIKRLTPGSLSGFFSHFGREHIELRRQAYEAPGNVVHDKSAALGDIRLSRAVFVFLCEFSALRGVQHGHSYIEKPNDR